MSKFFAELTHRLPEQVLSKPVRKSFVTKQDLILDWDKRKNKRAHFIAEQLDIQPGDRVLEMGYGLISFLRFLSETYETRSISLVPDEKTLYAYITNGLNSYIRNFTVARPFDFGRFDVVIGATPLCLPSGNNGTRQFAKFVRNAHDVLREGGRLYFQTIGIPKSTPRVNQTDPGNQLFLDAAKDETGCSLAFGYDAIAEAFSSHFKLVSFMKNSEPYLETTSIHRSSAIQVLKIKYNLILKLISNRQWGQVIPALSQSPIQLCVDRGYIEHMSFIFEKKNSPGIR